MVEIIYADRFKRTLSKIKDNNLKERVAKQIAKIIENPEIGKPMSYNRKGTRELYVSPFRLSYAFISHQNTIYFLDLYHKDEQ
ncbi:type II toxin-antitoxin system RelE/ParE family toxin [Candidatus Pacearchaeota archaeon]|nr:type II toxin-antitoxin system RelE/ParE family toxin [Candidatus Pacearchaeota archaeon]